MTTSPRTRRGAGALIGAAALTLGAVTTTTAPAASDQPACTYGDARSVLEAGVVGHAKAFTNVGTDHGIAYSDANCQVQLSLEDAHYTFTDEDVFAFQQTWFGAVRCWFDSRKAAVADFELLEDRAWLAPVLEDGTLGAATELELRETPVKYAVFQEFPFDDSCDTPTQIVYRRAGTIIDLAPGEYVTTWVATFAGDEIAMATVRVTILDD
ncbi:hypothetical protein [Ornithinicoccus halotolerans]|uniref:hypothetical protein n=1 Tax=Ornithinicoccus halotolerans TaxID=1748220 RepID=UPI001294A861|nr:hypothetical protein [Ornithinicoccus halotolerans]